jgi:CheY-like chemotaxis protein
MIRDITERQRLAEDLKVLFDQEKKAHFDAENARAEAVRANEAKDVFLAILSHELRTPLTSILVWAQLLKRGVLDPEKLKKGLNTIEESAQAQGQLINDLIDVSRIQSGKLSLTLSEIEPLQVVTAAIESVLPIANAKNIQIELHDELTSGKIYGDTGRVQQILWNLITNSIKFSSYSSSIEVRIFLTQEHNKDYVSLEVMDHGSGIDPKFLPYLFTRFSQQDSTITRTHGGLGIGLALVHDLTKAHGGFVKAESAGPEHGATFTVYLPLIQDTKGHPDTTPKKTLESPSTHPDLTGLRVLIVDDEPGSLEAFVETVQLFGGDPIRCISAKEAWTQFRAKKPDVIVSDIAMPIEDGYELLRKIRSLPASEGGDVPALALTAFAAHHDIERALAAGFQEHLSKPVNSGELGHAILRLAHKKAKK